jgi:hypothetical protein
MSKVHWSLLAGLLASALWTTPAQAIDSEIEARFQALEKQIADSKASPSAMDDNCCSRCAAWDVGAELTLLRPEIGSLVLRDVIEDDLQVTPSYSLNTAFRVWLGREWNNGLGWRVTYWTFKDSASIEFPQQFDNATISSDLNFYTVDFEFTRQAKICSWDIYSTIGARIGGVDTTEMASVSEGTGSLNEHFVGGGLTFSIGTRQALGQSHWSLYGGFRGSLLYGMTSFDMNASVHDTIDFNGELEGSVADQTVAILELQLGLQYERCTQFGLLFGRVGVETQLWELPPIVAGIGDRNIGLLGPTLGVGVRR